MQTETQVWPTPAWPQTETENPAATKFFAPATNSPYEFGRWWGTTGEPVKAAMWHADTSAMIDHIIGWMETYTAQDDKRKAAQMLFDQLTQTDGMTNEEWRYGA